MGEGGYDPMHGVIIDDPDKAYQPACLASTQLEESLSDYPSDDEHISVAPVRVPLTPPEAIRTTPKHVDRLERTHDRFSQREYRVEPLIDPTTPAYAPSQTFGSPSESPVSSLSGGCLSPGSVAPSEYRGKSDPDQTYRPLIKADSTDNTNTPKLIHPQSIVSPASPVDRTPETEAVSPIKHNISEPREVDYADDEDDHINEEFEGFEQDEQPESQVDGIIANIFGESDGEEEFEGFAENEVEKEVDLEEQHVEESNTTTVIPTDKLQATGSDDEAGSEDQESEFVSDFDKIMERKREELRRKRRRNKDIEFLNDSDDQIIALITRMKEAADIDRQLLADNKPAIRKLRMVSDVTNMLRRADIKDALVDNGMLSAITEWLAPLPGHTLPNLVIRDAMITSLKEFQSLSSEVLQDSGIGKALMYLYKHPRETRENKEKAGRLINEWLRPIFNLTSDYRTLTKEERKQLDYEHLPKRRNIDMESHDHRDINRELDGENKGLLRPGDPGWVSRARVPQPSNKDYIVRPKWRVKDSDGLSIHDGRSHGRTDNDDADDDDDEDGGNNTTLALQHRRRKPGSSGVIGPTSRIEAHIRNLSSAARQNQAKAVRAVTMSVEGRKMTL